MTIFDIDFPQLVKQLLPVRLRKSKTVRWLQCLIAPVIELYELFITNRNGNLYLLGHSSQIVYLQAVLNDVFDPISRGIYIEDEGLIDPLYIHLDAENEPIWLGLDSEVGLTVYPNPQWLLTDTETIMAGYCFIVKVPVGVLYNETRMKALVDKYRLPSKNNYSIVVY